MLDSWGYTHSEYVKLTAFPQQKLLREHVLRYVYTYIAYSVFREVWRAACLHNSSLIEKWADREDLR
jgi:hypothetical protein